MSSEIEKEFLRIKADAQHLGLHLTTILQNNLVLILQLVIQSKAYFIYHSKDDFFAS